MSSRISVEKEKEIHSLFKLGWRKVEIAKHLKLSIETVRDHLDPDRRAKRYADIYARNARDKQDPEKMKRIRERRHEYYLRKKIRSVLGDDYT